MAVLEEYNNRSKQGYLISVFLKRILKLVRDIFFLLGLKLITSVHLDSRALWPYLLEMN